MELHKAPDEAGEMTWGVGDERGLLFLLCSQGILFLCECVHCRTHGQALCSLAETRMRPACIVSLQGHHSKGQRKHRSVSTARKLHAKQKALDETANVGSRPQGG